MTRHTQNDIDISGAMENWILMMGRYGEMMPAMLHNNIGRECMVIPNVILKCQFYHIKLLVRA
jgi:hypothetical protein